MPRRLLLWLLFAVATQATAQVAVPAMPVDKAIQPIDYTQMGAPLPLLRLLKCEDTISKKSAAKKLPATNKITHKKLLTNKDFDNGASLFVIVFNPNCGNCEDETEHLEKNISVFKKSKIIMLADPLAAAYVPAFVRAFHIGQYPAITLGIDSSGVINKIFLKTALPQINIYDRQRKLVKTFSGGALIDSLKAYIQ